MNWSGRSSDEAAMSQRRRVTRKARRESATKGGAREEWPGQTCTPAGSGVRNVGS